MATENIGRKKTTEEIDSIRHVQEATQAAMHAVILYIQTNEAPMSEEAHSIIDKVLDTYDCHSPEGHIVACGAQSAEPHIFGTGPIESGVPVVIDIYPQSKTTGYFADMSRTVCKGESSNELRSMYSAVLRAQEACIEMIAPGVSCADIHKKAESVFAELGYLTSGKGKEFSFAEGFVHSIGHGVGLSIHETPKMGRDSTDVLEVGDLITIEPGLYYKNIGGVRIEDLLLVTSNSYYNLTHFPKHSL